jgi:histidine phosphotransferase ChpT
VSELRLRLQLYAAVFGEPGAMSWAEIHRLLGGAPGAHRVAFQFQMSPQINLPPALVQLVLAAAMLGAEALPRGGTVRLSPAPGGPSGGAMVVIPEGRIATWPHSLLERLAGLPPAEPDTPRALLAPWMLALAEAAGYRASLGLGQPGLPPLLLLPNA